MRAAQSHCEINSEPGATPLQGGEDPGRGAADRTVADGRTGAWGSAFVRFLKFGLVGGSGVVVDMLVFFALADRRTLYLPVSIAKAVAAEVAILNNFAWNDQWTFRDLAARHPGWWARGLRFMRFNSICLAGILLNVLLLNAQIQLLHVNMYAANLVAIFLVSLWNFVLNLKFGWRAKP
jgi:dolichol-phosphate mannosyltransferase